MKNPELIKPVRKVMELLVAQEYKCLEVLTEGNRLDAPAMAGAIVEYGRKLILPPEDGYELMNVVTVLDQEFPTWSVTMPLWMQEEGRSDLSIELTIRQIENSFRVELDDIHVL